MFPLYKYHVSASSAVKSTHTYMIGLETYLSSSFPRSLYEARTHRAPLPLFNCLFIAISYMNCCYLDIPLPPFLPNRREHEHRFALRFFRPSFHAISFSSFFLPSISQRAFAPILSIFSISPTSTSLRCFATAPVFYSCGPVMGWSFRREAPPHIRALRAVGSLKRTAYRQPGYSCAIRLAIFVIFTLPLLSSAGHTFI